MNENPKNGARVYPKIAFQKPALKCKPKNRKSYNIATGYVGPIRIQVTNHTMNKEVN